MGLAIGTLLTIIIPRPRGGSHRVQRPFVKGLAQELRAGPTMVNPMLLSTGFDDWGDTAVALDRLSCPISVSTTSERSDESWRHSGARTGEGIEDKEIRRRRCKPLDLRIVRGDRNPHLT